MLVSLNSNANLHYLEDKEFFVGWEKNWINVSHTKEYVVQHLNVIFSNHYAILLSFFATDQTD